MTNQDYYSDVNFVDNHPVSSDEFQGQAHQRMVKTIVSILRSSKGGRAIGLEGM